MPFSATADGYNCSMGHFRSLHHGTSPQDRVATYRDAMTKAQKNSLWSVWCFSDNLNKTKLEGNWGGKRFSEFLRDNDLGVVVESPPSPSSHGALAAPIQAWLWTPDFKKVRAALDNPQFWTDLESKYAQQIKEVSSPPTRDAERQINQDVHAHQRVEAVPAEKPKAGRAAARKSDPGYYWTKDGNIPAPEWKV